MDSILVVGAGSIGTLTGGALIEAGLKVTFAGRPGSEYTENLKNHGFRLLYANGENLKILPSHPRVRFVDTATNLGEKFSVIIVAVKSINLVRVASYIKAHSTPDTVLIHAQNGIPYWWFNNENYLASLDDNLLNKISCDSYLTSVDKNGILQKYLSDRIVVGCVVKAPCQRTEDGQIRVKKVPRLTLGLTKDDHHDQKYKAIVEFLCDLFSQNGLKATYTDNIRSAVCNKLAVNVTTNVLSALTGRKIADLTANSYTNSLIQIVIAEANRIFGLYGIKPQDLPTEQAIYSYIKAPGSQSHLPSLAQDFAQHKLGEINLITALVEMANIAHLEVPTLSSLSQLLELCQTYSFKNRHGESHILTLDRRFGYCTFTNEVWESSLINKEEISNLSTCLLDLCALGKQHMYALDKQLAVG